MKRYATVLLGLALPLLVASGRQTANFVREFNGRVYDFRYAKLLHGEISKVEAALEHSLRDARERQQAEIRLRLLKNNFALYEPYCLSMRLLRPVKQTEDGTTVLLNSKKGTVVLTGIKSANPADWDTPLLAFRNGFTNLWGMTLPVYDYGNVVTTPSTGNAR